MPTPNQTAYITVINKDNVPCQYDIAGDIFTIGRSPDNDLQIKDLLISRNHAEIVRTADGRYVFHDKESKSGSFINGRRVTEQFLKSGDEIVLGDANVAKIMFGFISKPSPKSQPNLLAQPLSEINMQVPTLTKPTSREMSGTTVITEQETRFLNTELMQQPKYVTGRTLQRMTSLYEITHKLLPVQTVEELTTIWLDAIFKALPVEHGAIILHNQQTDKLEIALQRDRANSGKLTSVSKTIAERTFHENIAILTSDASTDDRFATMESIIIQNIKSVLAAPISSKRRVWGVCYLYSRTQTALFDTEDLEFLMATAREAGLVMENLSLFEELRATQEQLIKSEKLAAIGKLAGSISHELRNRLALLSSADLIEMKYEDDPEVKQFAELVRQGQQRALALVEEIRSFARNRPMNFDKAKLPIVKTIERTLSLLRLDYGVMKRTLQFQPYDSPELAFNEEKFEQVLMNLIRNAVDATPQGTGHVLVTLHTENNHAVVRVADNGTGMPPEILSRIFEPFFTTKGDEGTGLGLEICRRIIEAHGGTITCQSQVGKGTCFSIRLPL